MDKQKVVEIAEASQADLFKVKQQIQVYAGDVLFTEPQLQQFAAAILREAAGVCNEKSKGFAEEKDEEATVLKQRLAELEKDYSILQDNYDYLNKGAISSTLKNAVKDKRIRELEQVLQGFLAIVSDSQGVVGYHLNGAIAEWDEFDEIEAARKALGDK